MNACSQNNQSAGSCYVSTGHLPPNDQVARLVAEAHEACKANTDGQNAQVYPALARVPSNLFGVCVVDNGGNCYAAGDSDYEFTIMRAPRR